MKKLLALVSILWAANSMALELVIGEERLEPGLVFIFEGAIKDHVQPAGLLHLKEHETHVHIEARVNWDTKNTPQGTPSGGFVPYLHITSRVINQKTGLSTFIDVVPHINLVDNFHYARNITLPGSIDDKYTVTFNIIPPAHTELAIHRDWLNTYGKNLSKEQSYTYKDVDFSEIARASRTTK
jgi:uncharacterized protein involved in high-affinity Fe2+ transport|tara:strand:+ start:266 stop:814 length:549 start_codon:yes stop_codon:yes gene_type:complete